MPQFHINKYFGRESLQFWDFNLIQIGRLYFSRGEAIKPHKQSDWYELTIITDGEGTVLTNGIETKVGRGAIYLSLPFDTHEIRSSESNPLKYDFITFYTKNEAIAPALVEIAKALPPDSRVFFDERVSSLVCDALNEFVSEREFSRELLYSIFNQIMIYIIRAFAGNSDKTRVRNASGADTICYKIMNYIDTHVYTMSGLDEITDELKYNYTYLSALFKKNTGNTILSYYRIKRLEAAKQLILEGAMNISEIADTLNYSSLYAFSRAFKETYGISPKQFSSRAKNCEKEE